MRRYDLETVYTARCPRCKEVGGISLALAGRFWLAGEWWQCGSCGARVQREEMDEEPSKPKEEPAV